MATKSSCSTVPNWILSKITDASDECHQIHTANSIARGAWEMTQSIKCLPDKKCLSPKPEDLSSIPTPTQKTDA